MGGGGDIWNFTSRLPLWARGGGRLHIGWRTLAYGAAGFGLITTATAMAALHPLQQVYFNALVDTKTPGALAHRYDMDYSHLADRKLLDHLLDFYPDGALRVWKEEKSASELILPSSDRERIVIASREDADFHFYRDAYYRRGLPDDLPIFHSVQAYGNAIGVIIAPNSAAYRAAYRAAYSDVESSGTLLARSEFDVYAHNGALYYLNANCARLRTNTPVDIARVFLHIFPANPADLPSRSRERGFENRDFYPRTRLILLDGKCIYKQSLPDYPIARIATGEHLDGEIVWRADIDLAARAAAQAVYDSIAAGDYGPPAARADFDVYLRGNGLAYIKENCVPGDTDARFFLHIIPADLADLPAGWREHGFENLDFRFADHGAYAGDKCVVERELPAYPIERIRTGQFVSGEGRVWSVEFPAGQ